MKQHIASLSYGKDSMAMIHVIVDVLGWPLDRIITADVWATDTIPADLPPMVEFKKYADEEIKKRWGIEVEHFCAMEKTGEPNNYEKQFYTEVSEQRHCERLKEWKENKKCHNENGMTTIYGFPLMFRPWCNSKLKVNVLNKSKAQYKDAISYIGIASDEPNRFHTLNGSNISPLVEAGWTEQMCRNWCEENELLSPIYSTSLRGGCWFCHNQPIEQLRQLRKNYPDLWALLLKWDNDSTATFKPNGKTVHDYDKRFQWEDEGYKPTGKQFRWEDVKYQQMNIEQFLEGKD